MARYFFFARIKILTLTNLTLDICKCILGDDAYICTWLASRWPDIIFDARIEILTLTNLPLDIYKGILKGDLYICTWLASSSLQVARYYF